MYYNKVMFAAAGLKAPTTWEEMVTASLVVSVPVVIGFLLLRKHFVAGLASGSIKEDPAHRGRVDSAEPRTRRRAPGVTRRVRGVGGQARVATGTSATVATRSSCSALSRTRLKAIGAWLFTSCPAFGTTVSWAPGRAAR
jgi:hypothetical protein